MGQNERMSAAAEVDEGAGWVVTDGPMWRGAVKDSISGEVTFELQDLRNSTICRQMMMPLCAPPQQHSLPRSLN